MRKVVFSIEKGKKKGKKLLKQGKTTQKFDMLGKDEGKQGSINILKYINKEEKL